MLKYLTIIYHLNLKHQIILNEFIRQFTNKWDVIHILIKLLYKDVENRIRLIPLATYNVNEIKPKIPYDTTILKLVMYDELIYNDLF